MKPSKFGQLHYSAPNRLMLFYSDAQIPGDYVLVSYIEDSETFRDDVVNNQPLEYWGNKLIMASRDGEGGERVACAFCPGTTIYRTSIPYNIPRALSLKTASLTRRRPSGMAKASPCETA